MASNITSKQAQAWFTENRKRKRGRPRKFWSDTLPEDLQNLEMTWDDYEESADDQSM